MFMQWRRILVFCFFLLACSGSAFAQNAENFYLKNGDRVVFYGDSITDQRLYTTFAETFVLTRFPNLKVDFVHSGWGGDRVTGGGGGPIDVRLQRDVLTYKPSVVTIMLGMNDGSYRAFDQGIFDAYSKGYTQIVERLKKELPAARITVIQPSPYDDVTQAPKFEGGYNAVLMRYSDFLKELAAAQRVDVADLNTPVVASLQKAKETDAAMALKIIPDRVHPAPAGHMLMAAALLKAWRAPALVSAVEIDAAAKRIARAANATASDLKIGETISWTQKDNALPFPIELRDAVTALAIQSSDVIESLNQQTLKASGLPQAQYSLKIDDVELGLFSREQLAQGINLATLQTPMTKQAASVHALTVQHNNIHAQRWRQIQVPLQNDKTPAVQQATATLIAALDAEEGEIIAQQRAAAQPVAHRFELSPKP